MTSQGERFTVRGSEEVESLIGTLVGRVARIFKDILNEDQYRALILIGGYGRGEGGVEVRDGDQRPHNNLDFLLITKNMSAETSARIHQQLDGRLKELEREYDVGIDVSMIPQRKLLHSACLVMWYDMRYGHKTILGDRDFVPSLHRYSVETIDPEDVRWLLVNRGSQLIVTDLLLARKQRSLTEMRYIIRLTMKAIIGYGDALLFFLGAYHWSYREKGKRMERQPDVPAEFRELYAEAIDFRFQPEYDAYIRRDIPQWVDSVRELLEGVHRECESKRMGIYDWSWEEYPRLSLRHDLWRFPPSFRRAVRKLANLLSGPSAPAHASWMDRVAHRAAGHRGLLPACFPTIVYGLESETLRQWTRHALAAQDTAQETLALAFLEAWGRQVDPNFFKVSQQLGLPLEPRKVRA